MDKNEAERRRTSRSEWIGGEIAVQRESESIDQD